MVTKYDEQGFIVFADADRKLVDARATLEALSGRLDEDKRQSALEQLDTRDRVAAAAPASAPSAAKPSAKAQIDELKRDKLSIDLAERAGALIPIDRVEAVTVDAIVAMQAAFDVEARSTADQLTIDLDLSPERNAMIMRRLRTLIVRARQAFAGKMLELAGDDFEAPAEPIEQAAEPSAAPGAQ